MKAIYGATSLDCDSATHLQRLQATTDHYLRTAALQPHIAGSAYSDLGVALSSQGQLRAAAHAYSAAIELVPTHGVAYNNLASLVAASGRRAEALQLYLVSHRLQPQAFATYPQMHLNVAGQLVDAARYDEALRHYEHGLGYAAQADDTLARIIHLRQRVCDWAGVHRAWPSVRWALHRALRRSARPPRRPVLPPMHASTLTLSPAELIGLARAHAAAIEAEAAAAQLGFAHPLPPLPQFAGGGEGGRVLRVGLISSDVKRHPVRPAPRPSAHVLARCPWQSESRLAARHARGRVVGRVVAPRPCTSALHLGLARRSRTPPLA